jgi:glycosyltransferase involved in cell wall biosynthesis
MSTSTRVLHVITRLELGGAQGNTLHTVATLDRARFEPGLAWGPGDMLDGRAREFRDVALFQVPDLVRPPAPGRDLAALATLRRVMRSWRPRVVHTHSSKAGILGRLAARLEGVPAVVHSVHGFGFTPLQPAPLRGLFLALERLAARWTHAFVVVARAHRRLGATLGVLDPERTWVIRSGIPLHRFRGPTGGDALRWRLGIAPGTPLVVQVGNFKPQKAPLDFVRVAARVARQVPEARFLMAGDGPLRGDAERLASRLGLGSRLLTPGWVEDVPALLDAATVAVLTSRHEGLPRAVVEALAAGVPVVATAVDGTPEVVRPGVNGFLAGPGDVEALAGGVVRLLRDRELRERCGRGARVGLDEFDIDAMVRRQEELYEWVLQQTSW